MKHLFIINPAAGSYNRTEEASAIIHKVCRARKLDYEIRVSTAPGECARIAREAARTGEEYRIYACGGDGTLSSTISGIMQLPPPRPPIGYLPGGSTNDFALSLGLPLEIEDAAQQADHLRGGVVGA